MEKYLAPGVYVEEFDFDTRPIEGVGTSTAGFIGAAQRGPVVGCPQLVTSVSDFRRIYGEYLSVKEYGTNRFLPYAVEHFFSNGGSRCYVARVAPADAVCASGSIAEGDGVILQFTAKNPGSWGNDK